MMLATATDKLIEGDIFGFIVNVFSGSIPLPILAAMVFGSIGVSYYIVQRSVAIPIIMLIIVGGSTIQLAPTFVQQGVMAGVVIAIAGLGYVLLNRVRV